MLNSRMAVAAQYGAGRKFQSYRKGRLVGIMFVFVP
jgi:hypothetical protein